MSLISRLHHVLEGRPKDQYVELKTTTPMNELKHIANLDGLSNDRLKFVERLEDGEYGLLDMGENIFYRTAKDVERGFETYSGTIMTFEDPEVKKWLVANIGGEQGITNGIYGKVGVRGVAGEVTYEQALAAEDVSIPNNKSIRRFNELVYFKNLKKFTFVNSSIEEISLPYMSIGVNGPFYNCTKLRKLTTRYGLDISGSNFLRSCSTLSDLDTSRWTFSGSSTERMFEGCISITNLDLRNLGMDTVVDSSIMFNGCTSLQTLDTSKWNLGNLSNGQFMFSLTPLISLDTSGWVLSSLSNAAQMFQYCSNLITLGNTSGWGLERLTNATAMFHQCRSLQSLDTSGWNLENVTTTRLMFDSCMVLTTLGNTSRWNLIRCTDMQNLLLYCNQLTKVDLTYTSTPRVAVSNLTNVFLYLNTGNLESIVGDHTETDNVSVFNGYNSTEFNISNLGSLNLASILAIIRGLGTNRARKRFVLSRDFDKSRIPQEYKTMLENKNWELT